MKIPDRIPGILPVPGFPGYAVASQGNVWSFKNKKPRRLKPINGYRGRLLVTLSRGNKTTTGKIHRLVLLAFVGPPPDGMECRHLNGDPKDNRLENLCWGTRSENQRDSITHGTARTSRLSNEQIRELRAMPGTQRAIAAKFGISQGQVSNLKLGKQGDYSLRVRKP